VRGYPITRVIMNQCAQRCRLLFTGFNAGRHWLGLGLGLGFVRVRARARARVRVRVWARVRVRVKVRDKVRVKVRLGVGLRFRLGFTSLHVGRPHCHHARASGLSHRSLPQTTQNTTHSTSGSYPFEIRFLSVIKGGRRKECSWERMLLKHTPPAVSVVQYTSRRNGKDKLYCKVVEARKIKHEGGLNFVFGRQITYVHH
jgi:hypothetical protein